MNKHSQKNKILFLHAGAELYGADKILLEILKNIDKSKFEPMVLLPNDGPLVNEIKKIGVYVEIIGYPILRRKFFTLGGILNYTYNFVKYSFKIAKFAKSNRIDLVHVNTTAVLEGAMIKLLSRIPIVWHVHEIIVSPRSIFYFISFMVQHFSNKIVTVSEATRNRLIESRLISKSKVVTIYNGIDSLSAVSLNKATSQKRIKEHLAIPSDSKVIGMIGRINAWKGQDDFVSALNEVLYENQNAHAILVGGVFEGDESRMESLKNRINNSFFSDRIHLIGFDENVSDFYATFDIFVLPSTQPDPFPTVVLEAMANKLPIVAYNHGGVTEMIEDGISGKLVAVKNIHELAKAINQLLNNDKELKLYGENGFNRQQIFFNVNKYVPKMQDIYLSEIE